MPTYDYKCDHCDYEFEVKQKMSDDPLTFCPVCNEKKVKKIIKSTGGFQLKGKGWFGKGGSKGGY